MQQRFREAEAVNRLVITTLGTIEGLVLNDLVPKGYSIRIAPVAKLCLLEVRTHHPARHPE